MTQNNIINSGLMTAFGVLVADLAPSFNTNLWYGLAVLVGVMIVAIVYELLP